MNDLSKPATARPDGSVEWNTGRLYNRNGQLMRAKRIDHLTIVFVDRARGIDGVICQLPERMTETPRELADAVMRRYDHNEYEMPSYSKPDERKAVDALMREDGGSNWETWT